MGELQSSLDALAAEDLSGMVGPQMLERTALLVEAGNRIAAELTRTVRAAELAGAAEFDGLKSMASWLRGHGRLAPVAAAQLVRSGRALEHLPVVRAAFAEGAITGAQVAVVAPIAGERERAAAVEQEVDLRAIEASLVAVAQTQPHEKLAQVVHRYLDALNPDGPEPDPTEGRRLTMARNADGSGSGRFDLDVVGFEKVQAVIESMLQAARPAGDTAAAHSSRPTPSCSGLTTPSPAASCRRCGR